MAYNTKCPHCGKLLPNEEKLAFHLMKECPEMMADQKGSKAAPAQTGKK